VSDETPEELNAFARTLSAAMPHPGRLGRDALLFAAGRAAQARAGRVWRLSTVFLLFACIGLGASATLRAPALVERERVVYVQAPSPSLPAPQSVPEVEQRQPTVTVQVSDWADGLRLRERVLAEGVDALPPVLVASNGPTPHRLSVRDLPELSVLGPAALRALSGESSR
jgi:hypothetical protein